MTSFAWLLDNAGGDVVYPNSFEELAVWMARDTSFAFPCQNPLTGDMELHPLCTRLERPTLSYLYRFVRKAVLWVFDLKMVVM